MSLVVASPPDASSSRPCRLASRASPLLTSPPAPRPWPRPWAEFIKKSEGGHVPEKAVACLKLMHISPHSEPLKQLIKTMLRKHPEHRPTAAELLRHPHIQPHVEECHNAPPVFLLVKSPVNSPVKSKNPKDKADASRLYSRPRIRDLE